MANYTIGDMVYESRRARGYSQEELSFGICSTSSLSRIENGSQIPGRKIFEALMQRLGISDSLYSAYISKEEMEICRFVEKLVWSLERLDFAESERLVHELEGRLGKCHNLEKQYVSFAKANIFLHKTGDHGRFFELLLKTIRITMADFDPQKGIERRLLTFHEITILNNIAIELYNRGKEEEGLRLLFELKDYMETHIIDEQEKARKYPLVVYNISTRLGKLGRYEEAYSLCSQGISCCIEYSKLVILPYLLANKAYAAAELGRMEEAEKVFHQSIILLELCQKEECVEKIRQDVRVKYGFEV